MWNLPVLAWNACSTTIIRGLTGSIVCNMAVLPALHGSASCGWGFLPAPQLVREPMELSGLTSNSITIQKQMAWRKGKTEHGRQLRRSGVRGPESTGPVLQVYSHAQVRRLYGSFSPQCVGLGV